MGLFLCSILYMQISLAQPSSIQIVKQFVQKNERQMLDEFVQLLSIPNIASDTLNIQKNTTFIMQMMKKRGIANVQLLRAQTSGVPPAIFGEVTTPGATQTLVFYAHYDGQPVNAAQWAKDLQPFTPKLYTSSIDEGGEAIPVDQRDSLSKQWRIYARSASDDKAGVDAILNAYDAICKSNLPIEMEPQIFF